MRDDLLWIAQPLHHYCQSRFAGLEFAPLGAALVCGENLDPGPWRQTFLNLNLYHVLVVSGAHLVLLSSLLEHLPVSKQRRQYLIPTLLLVFAFMTGLEAPLLRAFIFQRLQLSERRPPAINLMLSYLLCLMIEPRWIHQPSLHLSLMAGVALQWNPRALAQAIYVPLFLTPLLLPLGLPSLPGFAVGFLLAPLLEMVLFPCLGVIAVIPVLGKPFETPMALLMEGLGWLAGVLPAGFPTQQLLGAQQMWLYTSCGCILLSLKKSQET